MPISIKDWKEDERPRERLMLNGASSLSDSELLAIIINNGTKGKTALDISKELLKNADNDLTKLANFELAQFKEIEGIGDAKAITITAAFEFAKRIKSRSFGDVKIFRSPDEIANYFIPLFLGEKVEKFFILLFNSSNQIIRQIKISEGTLNASIVHPRDVFRNAVVENAASLIMMHNHPSGNPQPSGEDKEITQRIVQAGEIFKIKVLDHIIIAGNDFYSFANNGLI